MTDDDGGGKNEDFWMTSFVNDPICVCQYNFIQKFSNFKTLLQLERPYKIEKFNFSPYLHVY